MVFERSKRTTFIQYRAALYKSEVYKYQITSIRVNSDCNGSMAIESTEPNGTKNDIG